MKNALVRKMKTLKFFKSSSTSNSWLFNNQADFNFLNVINLPASLWICYSNDWFELQMLNDDLQTFRLPIYTWNSRSSSTQILSDEDESRKKIGNHLVD